MLFCTILLQALLSRAWRTFGSCLPDSEAHRPLRSPHVGSSVGFLGRRVVLLWDPADLAFLPPQLRGRLSEGAADQGRLRVPNRCVHLRWHRPDSCGPGASKKQSENARYGAEKKCGDGTAFHLNEYSLLCYILGRQNGSRGRDVSTGR